jgi:hypothetical protein
VILAVLTLPACAPIGTSGVSSVMNATHPTQEFCASRELTLDSTTNKCVPPSQPEAALPSPAAGSAAGSSQPHATQVQVEPLPPPPTAAQILRQECQRNTPSIPIESDAVISSEHKQDCDQMFDFVHYVRASGYRCDSISALQPLPVSNGFRLACNRHAHKYEIQDKGGHWVVTLE